jgi:RNA polymerase sigma factor (sigma-70 family)
MNELQLRDLMPQVLAVLIRRGADFATAEDAVQEALLAAVDRRPQEPPDDLKAWLITVAWRKLLDQWRSDAARRRREELLHAEPEPGAAETVDDTLLVLGLCCHPSLSPGSAIALTLRAVGGLTTAQIARAFLVPEATMAQRISRAKRTVSSEPFVRTGDLGRVLRVLYLIFNEGYTGETDLALEAIRLTRRLRAASHDPEVDGLLALMLLHHARRPAGRTNAGELVPLADQDRARWDTGVIAEAVTILQAALARDELGEYQAQAAIAALHDDAARAEETDWPQILQWYDELVRLTDSPIAAMNRAVAVGEVDGPLAGLRALDGVPDDLPRRDAVAAYLYERAGDHAEAARLYAVAAEAAVTTAERNHLTRQAARLNSRR